MKIQYLDRNWEAVGERDVTVDYLLPDEVVNEYQHIAQIVPDTKFSFLENVQVSQNDDIVEYDYKTPESVTPLARLPLSGLSGAIFSLVGWCCCL